MREGLRAASGGCPAPHPTAHLVLEHSDWWAPSLQALSCHLCSTLQEHPKASASPTPLPSSPMGRSKAQQGHRAALGVGQEGQWVMLRVGPPCALFPPSQAHTAHTSRPAHSLLLDVALNQSRAPLQWKELRLQEAKPNQAADKHTTEAVRAEALPALLTALHTHVGVGTTRSSH